jgi:hypothetical protein
MRGVEEPMEGDLLEVNGESLPLASTRLGCKPWRRTENLVSCMQSAAVALH